MILHFLVIFFFHIFFAVNLFHKSGIEYFLLPKVSIIILITIMTYQLFVSIRLDGNLGVLRNISLLQIIKFYSFCSYFLPKMNSLDDNKFIDIDNIIYIMQLYVIF